MRKLLALLFCMALVFTACSSDDDKSSSTTTEAGDDEDTTTTEDEESEDGDDNDAEDEDEESEDDDDNDAEATSELEEALASIEETYEVTHEEEECLLDELSGNPELIESFEVETADPETVIAVFRIARECIAPETFAAAFAEGIAADGSLDADQVACVTDEFLALPDEQLEELILMGQDPSATPSSEILTVVTDMMTNCNVGF